jgi:hypothetical protein
MRKVAVIGIDRVTEVSRTSVVGAIGVDVVVQQFAQLVQFWVFGVEELEIVGQVGQQIAVQTGFSPLSLAQSIHEDFPPQGILLGLLHMMRPLLS